MHELAVLALVVLGVMAVTAAAVRWVGPALRLVEQVLLYGSVLAIAFVMLFVGAEVVMRYAFNSPIQGHLEGSELLVPIIVFLALSSTQAAHGHVGMDILLENLPPRARRFASIATLLISVFICSVLAYFSFTNALQLWSYNDVTMTPPYLPTWPAAAAIPLGYGLIALRMFVQALNLHDPQRFPASEPPAEGFHVVE